MDTTSFVELLVYVFFIVQSNLCLEIVRPMVKHVKHLQKHECCWVWWCMPEISALGRLMRGLGVHGQSGLLETLL